MTKVEWTSDYYAAPDARYILRVWTSIGSAWWWDVHDFVSARRKSGEGRTAKQAKAAAGAALAEMERLRGGAATKESSPNAVKWQGEHYGHYYAYTPRWLLLVGAAMPLGTVPPWWWEVKTLPGGVTSNSGTAPTLEEAKRAAEKAAAK